MIVNIIPALSFTKPNDYFYTGKIQAMPGKLADLIVSL
jgi:hypothetical protein